MPPGRDAFADRCPVVLLLTLTMLGLGAGDPAGQVVDQEGKGVPGVQVCAIGRNEAEPVVLAEARTDREGRFSLPGAWQMGDDQLAYLAVFARAEDGRCGWKSTVWRNQPGSEDLTITLGETGDAAGQFADQAGKPIAGIEITIVALDRFPGKPGEHDAIQLPSETAKLYTTRSGPDGRFVLRAMPRGARASVRAANPEFGSPIVSWIAARPATLILDRRLGSIEGRFMPPGKQPLTGMIKLNILREPSRQVGAPAAQQVHLSRTIAVNRDGTFRMDGLPPGRYRLYPEFSPETPYSVNPVKDVEIAPGATMAGLEIPLRRLPIVAGRVLDETTGQGIVAVRLRTFRLQRNSLMSGNQAMTDGSGHYRVAVEPGMVIIQPESPPRSHMGMATESCPRFEVKDDRTWPDLKLARAVAVDGEVVDSSGKPVPGSEVHIVVPESNGLMGNTSPAITQPDGSFRLEHLEPDDRVPVRRARAVPRPTEQS